MSKNISAHKDRKIIHDTVDERQVWVDVFGYSDFESLKYLRTTEQRSAFLERHDSLHLQKSLMLF